MVAMVLRPRTSRRVDPVGSAISRARLRIQAMPLPARRPDRSSCPRRRHVVFVSKAPGTKALEIVSIFVGHSSLAGVWAVRARLP